jgi:hypothetical protein
VGEDLLDDLLGAVRVAQHPAGGRQRARPVFPVGALERAGVVELVGHVQKILYILLRIFW